MITTVRCVLPLEITTEHKININTGIRTCSSLVNFCYNIFSFITIVSFIPASALEILTAQRFIKLNSIQNFSTFLFCYHLFRLTSTLRSIAASEITTTEGKISVTVIEISALCFIFLLLFGLLLKIVHFIPASEITTTEGRIYVKSF